MNRNRWSLPDQLFCLMNLPQILHVYFQNYYMINGHVLPGNLDLKTHSRNRHRIPVWLKHIQVSFLSVASLQVLGHFAAGTFSCSDHQLLLVC